MAFTITQRQPQPHQSIGLGVLAAGFLFLTTTTALLAAFLWPRSVLPPAEYISAGNLRDIPVMQPQYVEDGNFWLVKLRDNSLLALSATNTHFTACQLAWNPDAASPGISTTGLGRFIDPCTGAHFDITGARVFGPAPRNMDRYEILVTQSNEVRVFTGLQHLRTGTPLTR